MASSPVMSGQGGAEEATRKREVRLMKNRYGSLVVLLLFSLLLIVILKQDLQIGAFLVFLLVKKKKSI